MRNYMILTRRTHSQGHPVYFVNRMHAESPDDAIYRFKEGGPASGQPYQVQEEDILCIWEDTSKPANPRKLEIPQTYVEKGWSLL